MNGRLLLAATARRLKRDHGDLLRPPVSFRRPDLDRAFDDVARRRAAARQGTASAQLAFEMPSDAAIADAQAAFDRGDVTLLEATFLADAPTERPDR